MQGFLKQSTASQNRLLGPFVDSTDGDTEETGLTIANTDIRLSKNGANIASKNSGGGTHDEDGWYQMTFDATDTDTVGLLHVHVHVAGALEVHADFWVLEEDIYDALFGAAAAGFDANQRVDLGKWVGTAPLALSSQRVQTAVAAVLSGGFNGAIGTGSFVAGAINATAIGTDAITAAKVQDGALTAAKFASGAFDAVWSVTARLLTAGTNIVLAKGTGVTGFNDPTVGAIADQVWDEAIAGHLGAGSTGEALTDAASGSLVGPGATSYVIKIDDGTDPVQGADVWVSTDVAGASVVAGPLQTDSLGEVTFMLDMVAYYAWVRKDGFNPVLADAFTVI